MSLYMQVLGCFGIDNDDNTCKEDDEAVMRRRIQVVLGGGGVGSSKENIRKSPLCIQVGVSLEG